MKKIIFILWACFVTMVVTAQSRTEPIISVDWKMIASKVKEHPEQVNELVARMCLEKLDTTLTFQDRIMAFYGQSYVSQDAEEKNARELEKLDWEKQSQKAHKLALKILQVNPLNMTAINAMHTIINAELKKSADSKFTERELALYANRMMRIMNTIAVTGDGTEEHPFAVTKVSDEYNFMRYYLDIWQIKMQMVTKSGCDAIILKEKSKYYDKDVIYFDCERVFELEKQKVKEKY